MKWFRLYSSVLHDPKVQRLSPALFKHWVNLLCLASEQDERGMLPCVDDIAFALRIKPSEAAQVMTQLRRAGLVDSTEDGRDFPHNWPQRQRESDDVSTRVRRHRERKAADNQESVPIGNGNVTLHETLRKRPVDTDSDAETEPSDLTVDTDGIDTPRERTAPMHGALALVAPSPSIKSSAIISPLITPLKPAAPPPTPIPKRPARAPDLLWDACVLACDGNGPANDAERGKWNRGLKSLRQSGATPEEIALRAERYRRRYGDGIPLNPMALAGNWTVLATEVHDHGQSGNHNGIADQRGARAGGRSARFSANTPKPLPDADYWERERQRLEAEGRLAKPRGQLPQVQ
jgi:hypothetical protein